MTETADRDFEEALAAYTDRQWLRFSVVSASLALTLVPAFSILDYFVYPDQFLSFLALRLSVTGFIAFLILLTLVKGPANIKAVTIFGFCLIQAMITYMIMVTEGPESPYYAGLNLPIIAMGFFLPTALRETVAFCLFTFSLYGAASLYGGSEAFTSGFLNNLFFLVSTAVIGSYSTFFLGKRRYNEFRLSYQLEERNVELAELNRRRTEFFANVSHELRTPLTLILAPLQDLLEGGYRLADSVSGRLAVVRDNSLRLLKLVNDLLDVLRMEEGIGKLAIARVDINGLLAGTVDSMTYLADAKDVSLRKDLAQGTRVVLGDVRALEKIAVNLINNAIKFTGKGGVIRVESGIEGASAVVRVADTGIGIPAEEQKNIFDRFHQVDGSSTRRYRGTGLGLALVKELTEKMGGTVEVESAVGQGTTMTVRLPLAPEGAETDPDTSGYAEDDGLEQLHRLAERRGGLTMEGPELDWVGNEHGGYDSRAAVLVVEDEPDMRRYLVDILEEEYRVLTAHTGTGGLRMALEGAPELVLLDLMLPEMDGLEVCRRIREEPNLRSQKIMLLTARTDEQSKITALEHGADDFLTKPFSSVEVRTRLRNLLARAVLERDLEERNRRLQAALSDLEAVQAQLIHSEKLNALGSLAAGLLHEINNPLNYSLTALQLIRGDRTVQDNALLNEVVGDIDEGMQRIRAIVSDLRAFAYPSEADKQSHFELHEVVETALRFTAHDLRDVRVVQEVPPGLRVLGSKSHIAQVLVNLLTNSAKAIAALPDPTVGEIRVSAAPKGGRVDVTVADNGVGMDAKTLLHAFDPFFTTRDVGAGVGLGLSICHTIVANHGGRIRAQSEPGRGAELTFDLPLEGG